MAKQLLSQSLTGIFCCCFLICFAQRNLIDIPSADIVEAKKLFFQEQFSFTKNEINTSTTLTYGIGHGFEVGVTVYQLVFQKAKGVEVDVDKPDQDPDFLINAQRVFDLNEKSSLGFGTRSGLAAARSYQTTRFVNFDYVSTKLKFGNNEHKAVFGAYYGNDAYIGEGSNVGAMAGVDFVLVKDKLELIGDFLSGTSSLSVINTGFVISLPAEWAITIGAQWPFPGSGNHQAASLQISKN